MKKFLLSCSLLFTSLAFAQVVKHNVQPKETVYGISKQYGITQQALKNANPFLKNRELQVGDVLSIPSSGKTPNLNVTTPEASDYEDDNFFYKVVQPKETVYRLAKNYNTTQETLKSLNSFIEERGLQVGDVVRIPKKTNQKMENSEPTAEGMYEVRKGDTVSSIARANGITPADIYAANKGVQTKGLREGAFIKIPKTSSVTIEREWFKHKVKKNETIFALLRKYDISLEELLKNNPALANGLVEGMIISVPMQKGAKIEQPSLENVAQASPNNTEASKDQEINIAWILPFYLDNPKAYKGERKIAQEFYMGGQIALDELIKQGKKINVKVIDSKSDQRLLSQFIDSPEINKYDAIIGPFYQDMVKYTSEKLANRGIPVFSPIVNSEKLEKYPNLYLASPRDEHAADILVEDIVNKHKNQIIKILTTVAEREKAVYLSNEITKRIKNAPISIVYNPDDLALLEQRKTVQASDGSVTEEIIYKPEIAVLASENSILGDRFVEVITQQPSEYISGFSLYFTQAMDIFDARNRKNIEALKKIGFEFTTNRMINIFGTHEKKILRAFEDRYCQKPTKYMAMGYDIVYDVVDRMNESGYISESSAQKSETRLSAKFGYQSADNGQAKVNKEVRVIKLN